MHGMERMAYLAHSQTRNFQRREREALAFLEDTLSRHRAFVSFSGGKDSLVCAHLANRIKPTPVVHFDSGGEHPLSQVFIERTCLLHGWPGGVVESRLSHPDLLELSFEFGEHSVYTSVELVRDFLIYECAEVAAEFWGCNAYVIGLRAAESGDRKVSAAVHGLEHVNASQGGNVRLSPIMNWSTRDVFAYVAKHGLALHPVYAGERLPGESMEDVRVGHVLNYDKPWCGRVIGKLQMHHKSYWEGILRRLPHVPWPA